MPRGTFPKYCLATHPVDVFTLGELKLSRALFISGVLTSTLGCWRRPTVDLLAGPRVGREMSDFLLSKSERFERLFELENLTMFWFAEKVESLLEIGKLRRESISFCLSVFSFGRFDKFLDFVDAFSEMLSVFSFGKLETELSKLHFSESEPVGIMSLVLSIFFWNGSLTGCTMAGMVTDSVTVFGRLTTFTCFGKFDWNRVTFVDGIVVKLFELVDKTVFDKVLLPPKLFEFEKFGLWPWLGSSHLKKLQPFFSRFASLFLMEQEKKVRPWFGPGFETRRRLARRPQEHRGGVVRTLKKNI